MKIVIIGGGVAGLSIGWRLAEAGCETVILERAAPGAAATWAAGGMIAATAENAATDTPEARLAQRSAALWPQFAAAIEDRSGRSISFRKDGSLIAAMSPDERAALRARPGATMLSRDEALAREPKLNAQIAGALWAPDDAHVDNRALGPALARAFVRAGGTLQPNESAVRIDVDAGRVASVCTPFRHYEADAYVLAAGAWSGGIGGLPHDALPPVIPVKGEMIALRPGDVGELPKHLIWGQGVYLIPRHESLFVGATTSREGFDTTLTQAARRALREGAVTLMPALADWAVADHWAGLRPGSPDDLPLIGESTVPGLFIASGQYRNGILFAPAIADALHSLIVERREPADIRAFDPKRFA